MHDSSIRIYDGESGTASVGKFAVAVSSYHKSITSNLLSGSLATLAAAGVPSSDITVVWVPGAWELAVAARRLIDDSDAVICLGAVIRGETSHDQHINSMLSNTLGQLSVTTGKPVAFGVLTCNTMEQAIQRSGGSAGNKGEEAAAAAVQMLKLFGQLS